jgi:tetratricopeptide (TPR) repeat protein
MPEIKSIIELFKFLEILKDFEFSKYKKGLKILICVVAIIVISLRVWISIPCSKTIILVADFDNKTQEEHYQVTQNIVESLRKVKARYSKIEIQKLNRQINEPEWFDYLDFDVRKASIVIWGQYAVNSDYTQIIPHFEILKPRIDPLELDSPVLKLGELNSFNLSINLAKDMSYLTLLTLGITQNTVADWNGAIASFSDALTQIQDPILSLDQSKAYLYRADSYFHKGDYVKAIADYDQTLKFKPNIAGAYNDRGIAYKRQGKYTQAVLDYDQALKLNPGLASAYSNRGLAYHEMGNYTQAVLDFNQALEINPDFTEIYYNRGNSFYAQGEYTLAIADYTQALKLNPKFVLAYGNRGLIYSEQEKYDKAFSDFKNALKSNPNSKDFYNRGLAYFNLGKYSQAFSDFGQVISLNPNDAEAYYHKARAYSMLGKSKDNVIENLKQAFNLDSKERKDFGD